MGLVTVACGAGEPVEPTAWAGADILRTGRGAAEAGGAADASQEACAAAADVPGDAAFVESPPADSDAPVPDSGPSDDGLLSPDVPTFDVIADFVGWDGGDLGTPAFDGAVFQELPPFADTIPEASSPEAIVEGTAEPGPEVVADASAEIVDAPKDSTPELTPVDTAEILPEEAADLPADPGPEVAVPDNGGNSSDSDAGVDSGDAQPDTVADAGAEAVADTTVDGKTDTAAEAVGDAAADSAPDAFPEAFPDATPDAVADAAADAQTGGDSGAEPCTVQACDDGEPCTIDVCAATGTCSHLAFDDGDACAEGTCQQALCSRNTPTTYGLSCKAIKAADPKAKSGVWWIDPDGPFTPVSPFATWCDMEGDGGGWTLLAKVAAEKSELGYDAIHWTAIAALHPNRPRFDDREARLTSYWALPFSQLRVGLKATKQTTWLVANVTASSLFHLIVQGKYVQLNVPEANWLGLLPGAQLLEGCRVQGFNAHPGAGSPFDYARARVGLVASAGSDCTTPASRIGLGLGGSTCGQAATIAAGGAAGCLSAGGPVNLPATGYLFAR